MAMSHAPALKTALKRGALIAAANWPLVVVQFIAESTLKLVLGVPVVGGIFLVVLLLDANVEELLRGDVREILAAVFSALRANPAALTSFALAFLVVLLGGSLLTFVVKGGTVAVLVEADDHAGAIERPPLRIAMLRRANRTGIDPFLAGCRRLGWRYVKLGLGLLMAYAFTAAAYFGLLFGGYALADNVGVLLWWTVIAAAASSAVIVWITVINFLYLITQIVMAVDDVGLRAALATVVRFLRSSVREIAGIFGVVLLLVLLATAASVLATGALSLIGFVPIVAVAVMPLQIAAWLVRGIVFQYLALTALGAYLAQYRHYLGGSSRAGQASAKSRTSVLPDLETVAPHDQLRRILFARGRTHEGIGHPEDGGRRGRGTRRGVVRAGLSGARNVRLAGLSGNRARTALGTRRIGARSTARPAATGRSSKRSPRSWRAAVRPRCPSGCS